MRSILVVCVAVMALLAGSAQAQYYGPGYGPPPRYYRGPPPGYYGPPPCPPPGNALYGAARGAAGGALIGAIAGNAGKGAAIGAAIGGIGTIARDSAHRDRYCR